jgi:hypothetical protein
MVGPRVENVNLGQVHYHPHDSHRCGRSATCLQWQSLFSPCKRYIMGEELNDGKCVAHQSSLLPS